MSETSNHFCPQCGRQVSSAGVPNPNDDQQVQCAHCRQNAKAAQKRTAMLARPKPPHAVQQPSQAIGPAPGQPQAAKWLDGKIVSVCIVAGAVLAFVVVLAFVTVALQLSLPARQDDPLAESVTAAATDQDAIDRTSSPNQFDSYKAVDFTRIGRSGRPLWEEFARGEMREGMSEAERAQIMAKWSPTVQELRGQVETMVAPAAVRSSWARLLELYAAGAAPTPANVTAILGPPDRVEKVMYREIWHYKPWPLNQTGEVEFSQGRVSKIAPPSDVIHD